MAHAVYAPEVRHPVEVGSAQEEHLVQWLSKRLGRELKLPALQAQGFELVGGRLLPGEDGARALFMYQNARGERVTLYLGSAPAAVPGGAEFRYAADGPVPGFYWVDEGFAYALSGALGRKALLQLAQAVYHQL
jgi:anti-sigma factor RsiW